MIDIQLIENNTKVRFGKRLWHESEQTLARCYGFTEDSVAGTFTCDLYITSKAALASFIELSFKNFNESLHEQGRKEVFWRAVDETYTERNSHVQTFIEKYLPYAGKLFTHQKDAMHESFFRKHNFLAMEMGTGKTIVSASLSRICQVQRTLIVCPAAVKYNWFRDLTKTFGFNDLYFSVYDSSKKRTFTAFNERFVIINYDILYRFADEIAKMPIGHFIFDEAHLLKNHLTGRTKSVTNMVQRFPDARITFLSGTPITNRVNDVFSYLKMVGHELGHNHKKFLEEYTIRTTGRGGERVTGGKNLSDLHVKLQNFMIRKTKDECLDLPDKVYMSYKFELDDYRAEYNGIIAEMSQQKEISRLTGNLHSLNIITSKAKRKGIIELAESIIDEGRKVVIFGSYKEPMADIEKHFGKGCVKIDGSVTSFQRDQLVQQFTNDDTVKVFLGNMVAAGVGINLTNASDVIFMNFPLVPSELYQSIDRCHRIGQSRSVNVHYTFCQESIDEYIYELIIDKETDINAVVDKGKEVMLRENFNEILIKKLLKKDGIVFSNPHRGKEVAGEPQKDEVDTAATTTVSSDDEGVLPADGSQNGSSKRSGGIFCEHDQAGEFSDTMERRDTRTNIFTERLSDKAEESPIYDAGAFEKVGSRDGGERPHYYLMSHPESDCLFIYNQEQLDNNLSMETDVLYDHEDVREVIREGTHIQMLMTATFDRNYTPNPEPQKLFSPELPVKSPLIFQTTEIANPLFSTPPPEFI